MSAEKKNNPIVSACSRLWRETGGGKWLLAVSGGADSTALLVACSEAGIPAEVAHCNFNLRGSESIRDRKFVYNLALGKGLSLHNVDFYTEKETLPGESIEMACRRLRYDFFLKLKYMHDFSRIVLAHNADDNIETFMLNALRGSGTRGLKAMESDTGTLLRPFLQFSRAEILNYLKANNQNFVTDSSNLTSDYRRNFIRNEILPSLESRWKGYRKSLTATINAISKEHRIIEYYIQKILQNCENHLPYKEIEEFPDSETLLFRFIQPLGGSPSIAREINRSLKNRVIGKRWELGKGMVAVFTKTGLYIIDGESKEFTPPQVKWQQLTVDKMGMERIKKAGPNEIFLPFNKDHYLWKKAEKGMKIQPLGFNGTQDLWKILKDKGVPLQLRCNYPVLVDKLSGKAIWIPGIKRSRLHLISENHHTIYHLSFDPLSS